MGEINLNTNKIDTGIGSVNVIDNQKDKKIDYVYDDLSKIPTKNLMNAYAGYKMIETESLKDKRYMKRLENASTCISRIESELSSRKELPISKDMEKIILENTKKENVDPYNLNN